MWFSKFWTIGIFQKDTGNYKYNCIFLACSVCGLPVWSGMVSGTHGAKTHQDTYRDSLTSIARSVLPKRRARDLESLSPISLTACRCREEHWSQQCVKFVIEICSVCDKVVCKVIPLCIKVPNGLLGFFVVCFPLETLQCLNILFLF